MSSAHTPGAWNYIQRGTQVWGRSVGGCRLEESDHLIADIRGWGHIQYLPNGAEVQDANGRLIAAAPDLLEALKWCKSQGFLSYTRRTESNKEFCDAVDRVDAAIAKATGAAS
ncbi:MAG: hypothetical protein WC829_09990 [Hyphomicrobium sp.]|jgi:hypothetical protein